MRINLSRFLLLSSCSALYLSLFKLSYLLAFAFVGLHESEISSYDFVKAAYHYGKRQQIFGFLANVFVVFLILFVVKALFGTGRTFAKVEAAFARLSWKKRIFAGFLSFAVGIGTYRARILDTREYFPALHWPLLSVGFSILLIGSLYYVAPDPNSSAFEGKDDLVGFFSTERWLKVGCAFVFVQLAIVFALYFNLYLPMYEGKLPFFNEYLNLESQVAVGGQTVGSISTLNSIAPLGIRIGDYGRVSSQILRPHLAVNNIDGASRIAKGFSDQLYYDHFANVMLAHSVLSDAVISRLAQDGVADPMDVNKFVAQTREREKAKITLLTEPQKSFLSVFSPWLLQQVMSRWYLHHHNFSYGPIGKVVHGLSWKNVFFQYGLIGGMVQGFWARFVYGAFNLENYFRSFVFFFFPYIFTFSLGIYAVTRQLSLTLIGVTLFLVFLYTTRFEYLVFGPGLSPLRHFFDIFVFYYLTIFLRKRTLRSLVLGFVVCFANFILNPEFGVFCFLSFLFGVATFVVSSQEKIRRSEIYTVLAFGILHLLAWFILRLGTDGVISLYLGGFFSPVLDHAVVHGFFVILFCCLAALTANQSVFASHRYFLFLASLFYSALILTYCLWGMSWNHVVSVSPILIISLVLFLDLLLSDIMSPNTSRWVKVALAVLLIPGLYEAHSAYGASRVTYLGNLNLLSNQRWEITGARILTSIPEEPFRSSLALIEKYRTSDEFVMISRFDNLLYILSNSCSALPGNELMTYMMSDVEKGKVLEAFRKLSPKRIFADVDMLSPISDELIDSNTQVIGGMAIESYMRTERVNNLKILFREISKGYKLIESSGLISVWERSN